MKIFNNDRHLKSIYNNFNNRNNKINSKYIYEFDYEFGTMFDKENNLDSFINRREHKREFIKEKNQKDLKNK